jgi:hypothetical protein
MSSVAAAAHHGSVVPPNEVTIEGTAHMEDYDTTPSRTTRPRHFNSTILSHAYYLFVQRVGHHRAGRVLHNVPSLLSSRPTFQEVWEAFHSRAFTIHDSATAGHVTSTFGEVGLNSIAPQVAGARVARRCQRPGEEPVAGTLPASVQLATIADSTPSRMSSSQVTVVGAGARVST